MMGHLAGKKTAKIGPAWVQKLSVAAVRRA
jgi:hypothetical protein